MTLEVNARMYRWNADKSKECKMCSTGQVESVNHVLVECHKYERERDVLIQVVMEEWGMEFFNEWAENEGNSMCRLLGIVGEANKRIIEAVKVFLKSMWSIRKHASMNSVNGNDREPVWDHTYGAYEE